MEEDSSAETITEVLLRHCARTPTKPALNWLDERCEVEKSVTYGELQRNTCEIAARLLARSSSEAEKGRARALLCYPPGLEFIEAFLACLRAGVIAVPVSPLYAHHVSYVTDMLLHIAEDCGASYVLTNQTYLRKADDKLIESSEIPWFSTSLGDDEQGLPPTSPSFDIKQELDKVTTNEVAFLQYTSGSTGYPKGVMISHGNLLHSLSLMADAMRTHSSMVEVTFLPHYHDMALITSYLQTLFSGGTSYAMAPSTFIENPGLWVRAFSKYRATHAKAPNFAFDLVLRKGFPNDIKLDSVDFILNALEPVFSETVERFQKVFAPYGLKKNVVSPGYGLAEHTGFVCTTDGRDPFIINNRIGCGKPRDDIVMKIVDPDTREEVHDSKEGEIWISSPSKALGYWQKSEATHNTFIAKLKNDSSAKTYLRTGDLGFISMGQLFCSGRAKDLIVYQRRKIHPSDIEIRIESSFTAVRPGRTVAMEYSYSFTSNKDTIDSTGVAYVAEINNPTKHTQLELQSLAEQIAARISRHFLIEVPLVVFVNPYTIPRTTSGKRQRALCKKRLGNSSLVEISRWSPHEELRSGVSSTLPSLKGSPLREGSIGRSQWKTLKEKGFNRRMSLPPNLSSRHPSCRKRRSYESMRRWSKPSVRSISSRRNSIDRLTDTMSSVIGVRLENSSNIWAYGCNSTKVSELSKRLKFEFGFSVEPHLFFTHQTPNDLMEKLQLTLLNESKAPQLGDLESWGDGEEPEEEEEEPADLKAPLSSEHDHRSDDIAIVGMSCSFAGCESPEKFWDLMCDKSIAFTTVRSPTSGKDIHAGFTSAVGMFDYKWFGMSEWEASTLDPQQSMLLQMAWECLHNAGYHPGGNQSSEEEEEEDNNDTDFGVFIAITGGDAQVMGQSKSPFPPATSFHTSIAANRIARSFNLTGPSMTINTACASSLTALDAACTYLKAGKCRRALVGSVNALLDPNLFTILEYMGMTSPDGKCSVFDESANGYVRGEGCGMVLVMPLAAAQDEGRRILAVVKSTCTADNGNSSCTLTAPSSSTQSKLIKKALDGAKIELDRVSFVEAHGTGTKLGDPIEIDAIANVFYGTSTALGECGNLSPPVIESVKANIGHLETGAGIASLIKTVQVLEHACAPGNAALNTINPVFPKLDDRFEQTQLIPNEQTALCPLITSAESGPAALVTGIVNCFGFGGSVGTAILQQYLPLPHMARVACGVLLDENHDGEITSTRIKRVTSVFKTGFAVFNEADLCLDKSIESCILLSDRIKNSMRDGTDLNMAIFRFFYGLVSLLRSLEMEVTAIAGNDLATVTLTQVIKGEIDLTDAIYSLISQDEMDEQTRAEAMDYCLQERQVLVLSLADSEPVDAKNQVKYQVLAEVAGITTFKHAGDAHAHLINDLRDTLIKLRYFSDAQELKACSNKPSRDVELPALYKRYPLRKLVDKALEERREEEAAKKMFKTDPQGKVSVQLGKVKVECLTAEVADIAHTTDKTEAKFGAYSAEVVDESGYVTQAGSAESLTAITRQSTPNKPHPEATPSYPTRITSSQADDVTTKGDPSHKETVLSTLYDQIKDDLDSSDVTVEQFASSGLFELGLDSFNVMQISDFIDQKYRVSKPFSEIIDYDTVGDLVEAITKESSVLAAKSKAQAQPATSITEVNFPKIGIRTMAPDYPRLGKAGYYTVPDMSEIHKMSREQLRSVEDFTVGRRGAGKLVFLGATDVTGLNIDELLCIEKECVEIVQQADSSKSDRLNKPALLYFEEVFPSDRSAEALAAFEEGLKAFCKSSPLPMQYSGYNITAGVLEIKVDKFY